HCGVPVGAHRLWRQGGFSASAYLVAGGTPCGTLAGIGADERSDAQDRDLWTAARDFRSTRTADLVVGRGRARYRASDRAVRRDVRRSADRHEALARLLLDREHRHR